jgi:putative tryptophan/tyrosine transport system substrate-binding protein
MGAARFQTTLPRPEAKRFNRLRRREFITLLHGAAAWPLTARAQSISMHRVGVLMNGAATETLSQSYVSMFVQALRQLGWVEGQNLLVDIRWNAGDAALARTFAAQLLELRPDAILTSSTTNLMAIQQATSAVPVVYVQIFEPAAEGVASSKTKLGGNLTGLDVSEFSIGGKWVDLLKEVAPGLARVAVMFNPEMSPQSQFFMRSIEGTAPPLAVQALPVHAAADIEPALESFARQPNGALILLPGPFVRLRVQQIGELADRYRLPSISAESGFARQSGLIYYGEDMNFFEQMRQAAVYIDRIIKGTGARVLPVQRVDKYTVIINLKTAKALNLNIPTSLLLGADELIE